MSTQSNTTETEIRASREDVQPRVANATDSNEMRRRINAESKIDVMVPVPIYAKKGMHIQVPVTVNGICWKLTTGIWNKVPMAVYLVLLQCGLIQPQRPGDEIHQPEFIRKESRAYDLAGNGPGSKSNPVAVS